LTPYRFQGTSIAPPATNGLDLILIIDRKATVILLCLGLGVVSSDYLFGRPFVVVGEEDLLARGGLRELRQRLMRDPVAQPGQALLLGYLRLYELLHVLGVKGGRSYLRFLGFCLSVEILIRPMSYLYQLAIIILIK
jgi:hypothetical protein